MIRQMLLKFWMRAFVLSGAEDPPEPETPPEGEEDEEEETPETRTVSAKELESMTARAADKASRRSKKEMAEKYGFDSWAKFDEWLTGQQTAAAEAQTEQEKKLADAEKIQKDFEGKQRELSRKELKLQISTAVLEAGVSNKKRVDRITALVEMGLDPDILEEEDNWDEAITSSLQEVKEDVPELFTAAGKNVGSGDGGSHGPSTPPGTPEAEKTKQLEADYAKRGLVSYPQ